MFPSFLSRTDYEDKTGSVGVGLTFAKDLGVIVRLPEGKYHMVLTN